jgi:hypothetical protein
MASSDLLLLFFRNFCIVVLFNSSYISSTSRCLSEVLSGHFEVQMFVHIDTLSVSDTA